MPDDFTPPARLFTPMAEKTAAELADYLKILRAAVVQKPKHFKALPGNIRRLSHSLTDERATRFTPDYMSRPENLAAYCWYFHPWNLYRLVRLFANLELPLKDGSTVIDLGAGPLTMTQALWIARPDLRKAKLLFHCFDRAAKPMKTGLDMMRRLAPNSPWKIRITQAPATRLPRLKADMVTASGALNEMAAVGGKGQGLDKLARSLGLPLNDNGLLLVVEPGTRLASRVLTDFRSELVDFGLRPQAPCPHTSQCPMPGSGREQWCHFNLDVAGAPQWLLDLSRSAQLHKSKVSLSFLAFSPGSGVAASNALRVVSEPFPVEGGGYGRYCCSSRGLALLKTGDLGPAAGHLVDAEWMEPPARDSKSQALMARLPSAQGKRKGK